MTCMTPNKSSFQNLLHAERTRQKRKTSLSWDAHGQETDTKITKDILIAKQLQKCTWKEVKEQK